MGIKLDLRKFFGFRDLWKMEEEIQGWWLEARMGQEYRNVQLYPVKALELNEGHVTGSRITVER